MLGLKLNHVSKRGQRYPRHLDYCRSIRATHEIYKTIADSAEPLEPCFILYAWQVSIYHIEVKWILMNLFEWYCWWVKCILTVMLVRVRDEFNKGLSLGRHYVGTLSALTILFRGIYQWPSCKETIMRISDVSFVLVWTSCRTKSSFVGRFGSLWFAMWKYSLYLKYLSFHIA